ncbi:hypothetical protein M569_08030, partial [Genlisea aurea]
MERNREARRASIVGANGFNRRRYRTNSLRDSPDDDGGLELQESVSLRDRVKKDRDRERERDLRERSSRCKRRRAERLNGNKDNIGGDDTSDESVDDDDDDEEEANAAPAVRLVTPAVGSISNLHHHGGSVANHHHSHSSNSNFSQQGQSINGSISNIHHRKPYPPGSSSSKVFRSPPVWKSGDEMIGISVPRKARSASTTKRSHDWISNSSNNNSGGAGSGGEQTHRQESSSPAGQGLASTPTNFPAAPMSPSSSNASIRKKLKPSANSAAAGGPKLKPPKASPKPSSSNPEELEIEIAEVLYGLMTQSQGPSTKKADSKETNRSNGGDAKSRNSSPISNSASLSNPSLGLNSSSSLSVVAPKRKRPRQVSDVKPEADQPLKGEVSSTPKTLSAENGYETGSNLVDSRGQIADRMESAPLESAKIDSDFKVSADDLNESKDFSSKIAASSPKKPESPATAKDEENIVKENVAAVAKSISAVVKENQKHAKFEIDLMAPPPQARSPERAAGGGITSSKLVLSMDTA